MASVTARSSPPTRHRIYECRWSWCREVFYNNQTRIQHIIDTHITGMLPDRKGDIRLLRLAQDGVGESMRLYDLEETQRTQSQASDLHLIEARTPVLSATVLLPYTPQAGSSSHTQDSPPIHQGPSELPVTPSNIHVTPKFRRGGFSRTPIFATLSSPSQDMPILSIPDSPTFDALVSAATRQQSKHHPWQPSDSSFAFNDHSRRDSSSTSSSGSVSFIEKQLTQSPPSETEANEDAFLNDCAMLQHTNGRRESIPHAIQRQLPPAQSQPLIAPIAVPSTKPSAQADLSPTSSSQGRRMVLRQPWYGTLPGHRRKSQTGYRKRPSAIDTSSSLGSSQVAGADASKQHTPRSDAFIRAATEFSQMQNGKHDPTSPLRRDFTPPGSITADPYSQYTGGPLSPSFEESDPLAFLQTQAPYHSQSQSQS
ncbi:hypothetical protein BDN71DRAFT_1506805 [Pleurotus eryngii]|uniref:C2H2-type domain-containing protein n=1 Tax=Pleurotus eryngii TaxID=5323 RepID=A0A9P6DFK7_PLEER|nr:hypothetical protein BDN71DRAFT_1506805 [Pleurotus eryngii]